MEDRWRLWEGTKDISWPILFQILILYHKSSNMYIHEAFKHFWNSSTIFYWSIALWYFRISRLIHRSEWLQQFSRCFGNSFNPWKICVWNENALQLQALHIRETLPTLDPEAKVPNACFKCYVNKKEVLRLHRVIEMFVFLQFKNFFLDGIPKLENKQSIGVKCLEQTILVSTQ